MPERKSPRLRGEKPGKESVVDVLDEPEKTELLDLEEYFKLNDIDIKDAIRTEGQFNGWLSEDIRSRYGIASNATQGKTHTSDAPRSAPEMLELLTNSRSKLGKRTGAVNLSTKSRRPMCRRTFAQRGGAMRVHLVAR